MNPRIRLLSFCAAVLMMFFLFVKSHIISAQERYGQQDRTETTERSGGSLDDDNVGQNDTLGGTEKHGKPTVQLIASRELEINVRWPVSSVAFAPNGTQLAFADTARGVYVWDLKLRKQHWKVRLLPMGAVSEEEIALVFTRDSDKVVLASSVRDPLVLDASSGETLRCFGDHAEWLAPAIALWHKDGTQLAVTVSRGNLHFWNPMNGNEVIAFKSAGRNVASLDVARCAGRIALGLESYGTDDDMQNGGVLVRELPSGRILLHERQSTFPVWQVAMPADGTYVMASCAGTLACWCLNRKEKLWSIREVSDGRTRTPSVAVAPDGSMVVYGSKSHIVLCDARSGKSILRKDYGSAFINAVAFSNDGVLVAAGAEDGAIVVWRLRRATRAK